MGVDAFGTGVCIQFKKFVIERHCTKMFHSIMTQSILATSKVISYHLHKVHTDVIKTIRTQ